MTYLCKLSEIPLIGSGSIVGTRFSHADANANADKDADTNGIRTETDIPHPSPLVGENKIYMFFVSWTRLTWLFGGWI